MINTRRFAMVGMAAALLVGCAKDRITSPSLGWRICAITGNVGVIESNGSAVRYSVGGQDVFRDTYWGAGVKPGWTIGDIGNEYPRVVAADISEDGRLAIGRHKSGVQVYDYRSGLTRFDVQAWPLALCWAKDTLVVLEQRQVGFRELAHRVAMYDSAGACVAQVAVEFDKWYGDSAYHDRFCASWDGRRYVAIGTRAVPANGMKPKSYILDFETKQTLALTVAGMYFLGVNEAVGNVEGRAGNLKRYLISNTSVLSASEGGMIFGSPVVAVAASSPRTGEMLVWTRARSTPKGSVGLLGYYHRGIVTELAAHLDSRYTLILRDVLGSASLPSVESHEAVRSNEPASGILASEGGR